MPNKDRTGPEGKGPQTGRGNGSCKDSSKKSQGRRNGQGSRMGRRCSNLLDE